MPDSTFKAKIVFVALLVMVAFVALFSRAIQLQVISSTRLAERANRQHMQAEKPKVDRGSIYDRNGKKLAESLQAYSIYANTKQISNPDAVATALAMAMNTSKTDILRKLTSKKGFVWIERQLEPSIVKPIEAANITGIYVTPESKRYYPNAELAATIIGMVGVDSNGLEGIEFGYEKYLKGSRENVVWAVDAKRNKLYRHAAVNNTSQVRESMDVVLTIDSDLQYIVEKRLQEAVDSKRAKGGVAIIMDPKTGEILALSTLPSFDPNKFVGRAGAAKNSAITDVFDPGSIFKPFMVAGALEEKIVTPKTKFNCEKGAYRVGNRVVHEANYGKYNVLTVEDIIKYSSNIGCVKISQVLGRDKMHEYFSKFGFGAKTGIDVPAESSGLLRPAKKWTNVDTANIAFGQGISVTPMQLIAALCAIANGGNLMKPYLVKRIVDREGRVVKENIPTVVRRVVSPEVAREIAAMMTRVVQDVDGTGKHARVEGMLIAGKTGTAQKYDQRLRAFSREKVKASFEGFLPAESPRLVMLVSLDEPQIDKWGGVAAAPVFKKISEELMSRNLADVVPRSLPTTPRVSQEKAAHAEGDINAKKRLTLVSSGVTATTNKNEQPLDNTRMPEFRGLTMKEVLKIAMERNIQVSLKGSGWAYRQEPAAGATLNIKRACVIYFSR